MDGDYKASERTSEQPSEGQRSNADTRKQPHPGIPPLRPSQPPPRSGAATPSDSLHPQGTQAAPVESAVLSSARPDLAARAAVGSEGRRRPLPRLRIPRSWQFWGITLVIAFSGMGVLSATALLRLPSLPNCPAIFWPTASASLRIYCAQTLAERRTVKDLLRAISLLNALPQDHSLRPEIDRNIEAWSQEILELGEESFQAGDLKVAIDTARKIPSNTAAHRLVEDQIARWETTWKKAEDIYHQAEEALKNEDLRQAFRIATQLLGIGNQYWENTQYRALNTLITQTREDSNKLDKAKGFIDQGGLTNLLEAVKLADEIKEQSYLYTKAQGMIRDVGREMLDLAEAALDRRAYDEALKITRQIPDKAGLQEEVRDFSLIAESQAQAWGGTSADLEAAIVNAQRVKRDRPLFGRAQQLITSWQLEIQDVATLDRAKQLAQPGASGDLSAAIAEAQRIPFGNPRRAEAEKVIGEWTGQIERAEDQPLLDRAEQYASAGDVASLQAAISEAGKIYPGRSLYGQASQRIDQWNAQIQQVQDQPQLDQARQLANAGDWAGAIAVARQINPGRALYDNAQAEIERWSDQMEKFQDQPVLDQARQLASLGNFGEAIAVANQIAPGRSLYDEAQSEMTAWRGQVQGQDQLKQAYSAANMGTPAMLGAAIEMASQVPTENPARAEADRMIDVWSYQILQLAQSQAGFNLAEAIAIAERVPPNTRAYPAAQQSIQTWRQNRRR